VEVVIPYQGRPHQAAAWDAIKRFSIYVWHRRAGKTVFCINALIRRILSNERSSPRGAYICPLYKQAKAIAWAYLKEYSRPVPGVRFNESELRAIYPNGAEIQLLGADNCDALRGRYLDSVVIDELAQCPPRLWTEIIRPALADRKGTAMLIGTPFGRNNLFYEFYRDAQAQPGWNRSLLRYNDTNVLDTDEIEALKREMSKAEFGQEFECDWDAAVKGSYFGELMRNAEDEGRITRIPHEPTLPVDLSFDLGMANRTVVWFWQTLGAEIRAIRCVAFEGTGLPDMLRTITGYGFNLRRFYLPHDVRVRELGTGKSRLEILKSLGVADCEVVRNLPLIDGIEATRAMLPKVWFDRENCFEGIEALKTYRTEWDDSKRVFKLTPLHSWESDYADSIRMYAVGRREKLGKRKRPDYSKYDRAMA